MATSRDRRAALAQRSDLNGIDFVEVVNPAQTQLRVHFMNPVPDVQALADAITGATITGGDAVPEVAVAAVQNWNLISGRPVVDVIVQAPGDFSTYTLALLTNRAILDPFFAQAAFSFKAGCPSPFDCEQPPPHCPPLDATAPPIDYLAKDFDSFRKALSDFSALRYPAWRERSEADFGVMFMEALASVADDLSYQQDRIAAEAWLETATHRRSLVRLARVVDYEPRVPVAARVWLQFQIAGAESCSIPSGLAVSAVGPEGAFIDFETGTGIDDRAEHETHPSWNAMEPYWWDDNDRCLRRGATEMWIERPQRPLEVGQVLLIDTMAEQPADPPSRQIVRITTVDDSQTDELFGKRLTRVEWRAEDALRVDHNLTRTTVAGNLVRATQGKRHLEHFVVANAWSSTSGGTLAIVRTGPNDSPQFLHTMRQAPLAWLSQDDPLEGPRPELLLVETSSGERRAWHWRRSLLGAEELEQAVTVDAVRYRSVDAASGAVDYDRDAGATLRFGDGTFGAIPGDGMRFEVLYRSGGGMRGNVAAGAITRIDATHPIAASIISVTNPLAASGGRDEEPDDQVREMAPQRFRATTYRAVRAEDYDKAAMTLLWVERAGTQFRYTGSWLTVLTAVDPKGSESLPVDNLVEITHLLDRYRLAGYEAFPLPPRYASLDLKVTVCVQPDAFGAEVAQAVLTALDTAVHVDGTRGFFHPDRFTFGVPLERSALEAVLHDVPGLDGVVDVQYRRRGHTADFVTMPDSIEVGGDEIVRVTNDPSRPERGSLHVDVRGGK